MGPASSGHGRQFGPDGAGVVLVGPVLQGAHASVVEVAQPGQIEVDGPVRGQSLQGVEDAGQAQEGGVQPSGSAELAGCRGR